jgi:hypothetical protein
MLSNTLVTNEVKNAAGTEVEFNRISTGDRKTEFAMVSESPALPNRLLVSHAESGTGLTRRRRSVVRFDRTTAGEVDTTQNVKSSVYVVCDFPVGNLTATTAPKAALAQLISFLASLGASTTILYDCTGNGADALISGGL